MSNQAAEFDVRTWSEKGLYSLDCYENLINIYIVYVTRTYVHVSVCCRKVKCQHLIPVTGLRRTK